jgi:transcriptional regulator with XRE-family HTH domain
MAQEVPQQGEAIMITEIGKELRKLRIDRNERLIDMAERVEKSAAFISAVEVGKKSPPAGFEDAIISIYRLAADAADKLRHAANRSRHVFSITPNTLVGRDTAGLMARKIDTLSEEQLKEIQSILMGKEK